MSSNLEEPDTLLLFVKENEGVIPEYQRQLYEASLLGISRVLYCFVYDNSRCHEEARRELIRQKLDKVCQLCSIESLNRDITVYNSVLGMSRVMKTNEEGTILSGCSMKLYDSYKKDNEEILQSRERISKILAKNMVRNSHYNNGRR